MCDFKMTLTPLLSYTIAYTLVHVILQFNNQMIYIIDISSLGHMCELNNQYILD